jgi:quercetin dioxygenase-like cupin family protein
MPVQEHRFKVTLKDTPSDVGLPERGWVNMDVRWLVTDRTVGATSTVFGVTTFAPGARHELHRHPHVEEVEYVVSGRGIAYVGDAAVELGPGEALFVPRNVYHGFENPSDTAAVVAWYYAGAASLESAGFVTREEDEAAAR